MHQSSFVPGYVSSCHLIGYLLQLAAFSGALLRQMCAQLPNADCSIRFPHSQEVSVLTVEGQTSHSLAPSSLCDGGCWPQGPAAQVEYLHLTLKTQDARVVKDTSVCHILLLH